MVSGIYAIKCKKNNKMYVGSSVNIASRFRKHKADLLKNKHHSLYLQRAWNKYGKESFIFETIEEVPKDELLDVEQMYLDCLDFDCLMNVSKFSSGGDLISYHPLNEEYRQKQSQLVSERMSKLSVEEKAELFGNKETANGMYGKNHTEETKEKMRQNRGDLSGDNNPFYGQSHTEETKQLLSDLASQRTGEDNPFFGKKHSKETKAKLSAKRKGKKPTNCKQPIIDGVKYLSINDASKALGIHSTTISYRCKSKSFSNYLITD